ncbi:MAG: hypothetical protein BWY63_03388 [Chloroflexi bacterium ADurb.Bin360]|nr:MAG: hypothetical protein BWY63_03388 [Chloroflexi bacterium ADurb.Bin360]
MLGYVRNLKMVGEERQHQRQQRSTEYHRQCAACGLAAARPPRIAAVDAPHGCAGGIARQHQRQPNAENADCAQHLIRLPALEALLRSDWGI